MFRCGYATNTQPVNNAGTAYPHTTLDVSKASIESMFSVNVFGAILLTQAVIPHMPPGGRIINISSVASKLGLEVAPVYAASKAALDNISYTWAQEVSKCWCRLKTSLILA